MEWDGPTSRLRVGGWLNRPQPPAPPGAAPLASPAAADETATVSLPRVAGETATDETATVALPRIAGDPAADGPAAGDPAPSAGPPRRQRAERQFGALTTSVVAVVLVALVLAGASWMNASSDVAGPNYTLAPPLDPGPFLPPETPASEQVSPGSAAPPVDGGGEGTQSEPAGGTEVEDPGPNPRPDAGGAAALLAVVEQQVPPVVDLTAEGDLDWVHWGLSDFNRVQRKRSGGGAIADLTRTGWLGRYGDNPQRFAWSDGTPIAVERGTSTGVYACGVGSGFVIAVAAGTKARRLNLYAGVWRARGRLEVSLGGLTETHRLERADGIATRRWAIAFRAPAGTRLVVRWTTEAVHEPRCGNVDMQAATLSERG